MQLICYIIHCRTHRGLSHLSAASWPHFTSSLFPATTLLLFVVKGGILGASSRLTGSWACSARLAPWGLLPSHSASF